MTTGHCCPFYLHHGPRPPIMAQHDGIESVATICWREYEALKNQLPPMTPREYERAIREIAMMLRI